MWLLYKHFHALQRVAIVEANVAAYLQPVALQGASGGKEGAWHKGVQPPLATQWHQVASQT